MLINQRYSDLQVFRADPAGAGAALDITDSLLINDKRVPQAPSIDISGAGPNTFGMSQTISVYSGSPLGAGTIANGRYSVFIGAHADLPAGVSVKIGTEAAYSADITTATSATDQVALLADAKSLNAFDIFHPDGNLPTEHDTVNNKTNYVKYQLGKQAGVVLPLSTANLTFGRQNKMIFYFLTPYSFGDHAENRATETFEELVGSGQTNAFIRGGGGATTWHQIGCHMNEITVNPDFTKQVANKGYIGTRLVNELKQRLFNVDMTYMTDSPKFWELAAAYVANKLSDGSIKMSASDYTPHPEVVWSRPSAAGGRVTHRCARTTWNMGAFTIGGETAEYPANVECDEPIETYFWPHLYQLSAVVVPVNVVA